MSTNSRSEVLNTHENGHTYTNGKTMQTRKILPEKQFQVRNSLLTDLFENPHIETIRHIFIASLVGLFINTIAHDYLKNGEIKLGLKMIFSGFQKLHVTFLTWIGFNVSTCFCYSLFILWGKVRIKLQPKSRNIKLWDSFWLLSLLGYYAFSFRLASEIITYYQLPPASSVIIALEQTRLLMKIHAFVRSNATKVVKYKIHSDQKLELPSFSYFLYFLYVPTIVYRDEYPRTKGIRWKFAAARLLEVIGVILYYSFLIERFLYPVYKDFGLRKFTWSEILISVLENSLLGVLFLLCGFYVTLHSVQNLFAELFRFGDRMFYKAWWTCTDYSEYFRTWNVIVHDWLYQYVYKDVYEIVVPGNKVAAKFIVFTLSAIVHEWVLTYMFGFFFPALFIQFFFAGVVLSLMRIPKIHLAHIMFWYFLALGAGSLASLYALEFFARVNMPIENSGMKEFFVPRWLTCDCIE